MTEQRLLENCFAIRNLSIEKHIYGHVEECTTAAEVWKKLKSMYENGGLSRKISLLTELISIRLAECADMQEYVDKIRSLECAIFLFGRSIVHDSSSL